MVLDLEDKTKLQQGVVKCGNLLAMIYIRV